MINLIKDHYQPLVTIIAVVVGYTRLQGKVNRNAEEIEVNKEQIATCKATLERYIKLHGTVNGLSEDITEVKHLLTSGDAGKPPFLTEKEHVRRQSECQKAWGREIASVVNTITEINNTIKAGEMARFKSSEELSRLISELRTEHVNSYTDMAVLVASISTEIKHLNQDWNRRSRDPNE